MTTLALFAMLAVFLLLGMPVAVGLRPVVAPDDPLLRPGLARLAVAVALRDLGAVHAAGDPFFFILGGTFMTTGGVAKRMIRFANACIGHLHGGLAMASVLACMLFAAVSGSSTGSPSSRSARSSAGMVKAGYPQNFAAGVICNAARSAS